MNKCKRTYRENATSMKEKYDLTVVINGLFAMCSIMLLSEKIVNAQEKLRKITERCGYVIKYGSIVGPMDG